MTKYFSEFFFSKNTNTRNPGPASYPLDFPGQPPSSYQQVRYYLIWLKIIMIR